MAPLYVNIVPKWLCPKIHVYEMSISCAVPAV